MSRERQSFIILVRNLHILTCLRLNFKNTGPCTIRNLQCRKQTCQTERNFSSAQRVISHFLRYISINSFRYIERNRLRPYLFFFSVSCCCVWLKVNKEKVSKCVFYKTKLPVNYNDSK